MDEGIDPKLKELFEELAMDEEDERNNLLRMVKAIQDAMKADAETHQQGSPGKYTREVERKILMTFLGATISAPDAADDFLFVHLIAQSFNEEILTKWIHREIELDEARYLVLKDHVEAVYGNAPEEEEE
jgi:hypothetical protein